MAVWRSFEEVPDDLGRTVVTVGNFDGMHLGHQHVVQRAREVAQEIGVDTVVAVTFDPHPIAVLRPEHAPPTLTTIDERLRLLGEAGVDAVLVIPFSREIAAWSPQEFIDRVLVGALHAKAVVVGANFRFGNRAAGDRQTLREAGAEQDFVLEAVELDGGPAGVVVDVHPHLPRRRRRRRRCRGARPPVRHPGRRDRGRQARSRPRLPDGQRAGGSWRGRARPTASTPAGCAASTAPTGE